LTFEGSALSCHDPLLVAGHYPVRPRRTFAQSLKLTTKMWYDPAPTVDYPTTFVDIYEFLNLAMSSRSLTTCAQSKIIHRVLSTPKSDRGLGIAFASESTSVLPEFRRLTSLPGRLVYGARGADYSLSLASLAPVLLILFSAWFLTEYSIPSTFLTVCYAKPNAGHTQSCRPSLHVFYNL